MPVIGISINEQSSSTQSTVTDRISRCTLIMTPSGAAAALLNQPTGISSVTDFQTKYPTAPEIVLQSVKLFLLNNPEGQLQCYACNDSVVSGNDAAARLGHLLKGIALLSLRTDLELSVSLCPEQGTFTLQADRTAIYSAIQSMCEKFDWLYFVNTANDTDTKAKAIAERDLYSSAQGHSSIYYGAITDNENKNVPVAVAAGAIAIKRDRTEAYSPPAGAKYPVLGIKNLVSYVDNITDYNDLKAKQINVLQKIPKYGTCLWGAKTLSTDTKFSLINTRMAVSVASQRLENALVPILFASTDPQGRTNREVDRLIISLMTNLWLEGGLSGETPEDGFRIEDVVIQADPQTQQQQQGQPSGPTTPNVPVARNLKKIQKKIYARFVEHVEQIEIGVFVVDVLPT
jgi:hypothetical protein